MGNLKGALPMCTKSKIMGALDQEITHVYHKKIVVLQSSWRKLLNHIEDEAELLSGNRHLWRNPAS